MDEASQIIRRLFGLGTSKEKEIRLMQKKHYIMSKGFVCDCNGNLFEMKRLNNLWLSKFVWPNYNVTAHQWQIWAPSPKLCLSFEPRSPPNPAMFWDVCLFVLGRSDIISPHCKVLTHFLVSIEKQNSWPEQKWCLPVHTDIEVSHITLMFRNKDVYYVFKENLITTFFRGVLWYCAVTEKLSGHFHEAGQVHVTV